MTSAAATAAATVGQLSVTLLTSVELLYSKEGRSVSAVAVD